MNAKQRHLNKKFYHLHKRFLGKRSSKRKADVTIKMIKLTQQIASERILLFVPKTPVPNYPKGGILQPHSEHPLCRNFNPKFTKECMPDTRVNTKELIQKLVAGKWR